MMRARTAVVVALVGAAGGCVESDDPGWGEVELVCEATAEDDFVREALSARMFAAGFPAERTWSRDGRVIAHSTYAYDGMQRLVEEVHDFGDGLVEPDGMPDQQRAYTHAPGEVVMTFLDPRFTPPRPTQSVRMQLDERGWLREIVMPEGEVRFVVSADGWLDEMARRGFDPELGDRTTVERFVRTNEELLASWTVQDSLSPETRTVSYVHDFAGADHFIRVAAAGETMRVYHYTRDGEGGLLRAAADEDGDGNEEWVVTFARDAEGGGVVESMRDGVRFRVHTFSRGCGMRFADPWAPRGSGRPQPQWLDVLPSIPAPYG